MSIFHTRKQNILVFSGEQRVRYLAYYIAASNSNFYVLPNKFLNLIRKIAPFLLGQTKLLVTDINSFNFRNQNAFDASRFYFLSWNDELEVEQILLQLPHHEGKYKILNFFSDFLDRSISANCELEVFKPAFASKLVDKCGKSKKLKRKSPAIFFAGQVNTSVHYRDISKSPNLLAEADQLYDSILKLGLFKAILNFNITESNLPWMIRLKIRHFAVNRWRKSVLLQLEQEFGENLSLCGPDFSTDDFKHANLISYIHSTKELFSQYRSHSVCLDLGSQCGLESLYPRSLEIASISPSGWVQVQLRGSSEIFGTTATFRTGNTIQEIVDCCRRNICLSVESRELEGLLIRGNIQRIMNVNLLWNQKLFNLENGRSVKIENNANI